MGILDTVLGTGQGSGQPNAQGPYQPGMLGGLQAYLAPQMYQARQQGFNQQNLYNQMQPRAGNADAMAMATDPQAYQMGAPAYLPQAPKSEMITNASGETIPTQITNAGGGAGHGLSISGLPIGQPPGTTTNPSAPPVQGNTINQGLPGSTTETMNRIDQAKTAGTDPLLALSPNDRGLAQAVYDGRLSLKDLAADRGKGVKTYITRAITAAHPDWDESTNESQTTYRKQFASEKNADIGGQVASINRLAGHLNVVADAAKNVDNIGLGGSGLARPVNALGNFIQSTNAAGLRTSADKYTAELSKYLSGATGGGVEERKDRREFFSSYSTPQEMGAALLSDIDFIEKQIEGKEQHRDNLFKSNPQVATQFDIASPQARAQLQEAKVKAHKLVGDYDEWVAKTQGGGGAVKSYKDYF